jgi:glutamate racemase
MKLFLERYRLLFSCVVLYCLDGPACAQEASNATLPANRAVQKLISEVKGNRGQGTYYSIPIERYSTPTNELPIGVFDSGIGGLTVLETILSLDEHNNRTGQPGKDGVPDFQNERFVYLGDQANMPYGNYAAVGKEDLLREFILRDAMFLLGNRYWENKQSAAPQLTKLPVKAIVIACNTATAYGLEDIRAALQDWQISMPVIGVVEAGANAVVQELPSNRPSGAVAVMATLGTCSSGAYPRAIAKSAGLAGKRQPVVWQQGSLGLAGAIEGNRSFVRNDDLSTGQATDYQGPSLTNAKAPIQAGLMSLYAFDANGMSGGSAEDAANSKDVRLNSVENYVKYDVVSMVESYRQSGATAPIERVILGCTHFPFESERIAENLQRLRQYRAEDGSSPFENLISHDVQLVDPGVLTAKQLFRTLTLSKLRSSNANDVPPRVDGMFLSVPNPRHDAEKSAENGFTSQYKYGRTAGEARGEDFLVVPLTKETMPESLVRLVSMHCKSIWKELP